MKNRAVEIAGFLAQAGWDRAQQTPLAADFSTRRFARLTRAGEKPAQAILMDAEPGQNTPQFAALAGILRGCELAAPEIYAADPARGLVLMEDFGDRNIGRLIDGGAEAKPYLRRAVDVLVHLHRTFDRPMLNGADLPVFGAALFASQVELFLDAYFPFAKGRAADRTESEDFRAAWKAALKGIDALPQTLMLRDFMPDNLMELSGREGIRATGLLDFQDGGLGPAAYDLASLCEAVRRDPLAGILDEMIAYYYAQAKPALAQNDLLRACRVLAAQRHTRILGIVARHARKTGRKDKLAYLPRIWEYLDRLMQDEALKPVREWIKKNIMEPCA